MYQEARRNQPLFVMHFHKIFIFEQNFFVWTYGLPFGDLEGRGLSKRLLKRSLYLAARGRKLLGTLLKDFRAFSQVSGSTQEPASFRRAFS